MAKYVLYGGPFVDVDGPHKAEQFGEVLELPDDEAAELIRSGAAILPQSDFDALFTRQDVQQYPNALLQASAPKSFKANLQAACTQGYALRTSYLTPPAAKENDNAPVQ